MLSVATVDLGFFVVVRRAQTVWLSQSEYRGVERLPGPTDFRSANGASLWTRYWEMFYHGDLVASREKAASALEMLSDTPAGEVIRAFGLFASDIDCKSFDEPKRYDIDEMEIPALSPRDLFIGFDVSVPAASFESLLLVPLPAGSPLEGLCTHINSFGLLDEYNDALALSRTRSVVDEELPNVPIAIFLA
jgi:hypothetical protein